MDAENLQVNEEDNLVGAEVHPDHETHGPDFSSKAIYRRKKPYPPFARLNYGIIKPFEWKFAN